MKRMIKYNDIRDFKSATINLKKQLKYEGVITAPICEVTFTEKIHGTNAAVCYSEPDGFWVQSRERILTIESDNAGCAFAAYSIKDVWISLLKELAIYHNIDLNNNIISLYYEWSGGRIQQKSAVTGLSKRSIIFQHFKVSPLEPLYDEHNEILRTDEQPSRWLPTIIAEEKVQGTIGIETRFLYAANEEHNIYNIMNYKVWYYRVDFNTPLLFNNTFNSLVSEIENESPIGKEMGVENNIGEGIVGTFKYNDTLFKFKVKGEKHQNSKIKKLKVVDEAKEQAKNTLAEKVATAGRCEQAWQYVFGIENEKAEPSKKGLGDFMRWIHKDIMKECMDDYIEAEIAPKEINNRISQIARSWFEEELLKESQKEI